MNENRNVKAIEMNFVLTIRKLIRGISSFCLTTTIEMAIVHSLPIFKQLCKLFREQAQAYRM